MTLKSFQQKQAMKRKSTDHQRFNPEPSEPGGYSFTDGGAKVVVGPTEIAHHGFRPEMWPELPQWIRSSEAVLGVEVKAVRFAGGALVMETAGIPEVEVE